MRADTIRALCCTGVDAAPGTLERALIRDSISQLTPFLQQHHIPNRPCGSLVCQWKMSASHENDNDCLLDTVLAESHNAGDTHATRLTPHQVHQLEPNVSQDCTGAVHIPGEIVVDPWLYSIALATHARENGATIYTNFEMNPNKSSWNATTETWTISRVQHSSCCPSDIHVPEVLYAKSVVNAAGLNADLVQLGVSSASPTIINDHADSSYHYYWNLLTGTHNPNEVNIAFIVLQTKRRFNIPFNPYRHGIQRESLCFPPFTITLSLVQPLCIKHHVPIHVYMPMWLVN